MTALDDDMLTCVLYEVDARTLGASCYLVCRRWLCVLLAREQRMWRRRCRTQLLCTRDEIKSAARHGREHGMRRLAWRKWRALVVCKSLVNRAPSETLQCIALHVVQRTPYPYAMVQHTIDCGPVCLGCKAGHEQRARGLFDEVSPWSFEAIQHGLRRDRQHVPLTAREATAWVAMVRRCLCSLGVPPRKRESYPDFLDRLGAHVALFGRDTLDGVPLQLMINWR
ncbi:hypothetical protein LCGC14_2805290 [marine sediment metagenome]|uniref:F-box domain-containing protein n=1 Tax=marine sediment metagenome TaxID=412755 RepID=A0A0F8YLI8_9ZZZZ